VIGAFGGGMMRDMATVLSIEDCYDLLEIAAVDAHNRRVLRKREETNAR
jgi:hypothetical protein